MTTRIALVWFRRDLRLADQPALEAAIAQDYLPLPVYIDAPAEAGPWAEGAASRAWLHRSLAALQRSLSERGSRLLLARGPSLPALRRLVADSGAQAVFWNRMYEPWARDRDAAIKKALRDDGLQVESFNAAQLFEPWTIENGSGEPYRVFTPFWRKAATGLDALPAPGAAPKRLPAPPEGVSVLSLDALELQPRIRWDAGFWNRATPGERGAAARWQAFVDADVAGYPQRRDFPAADATSGLSAHLHFGEISPRQCIADLRDRQWPAAQQGSIDGFVRQLGWREFATHLLYHFPRSAEADLTGQMHGFDWAEPDPAALDAWRHGRTGIPIVDAGMRELWATGVMHNRVRMLVGSLLTKNLRYHWRHGANWFWDTLVDADLANNSLGWQWVAGTGADAAPYFRIFNPVTQAQRFDPDGVYVRRWLPELAALPTPTLHAPWEDADALRNAAASYPRQPIVDLKSSREAALAAYQALRDG